MKNKSARITVVSDASLVETLKKIQAVCDRLEKKESESMVRKGINLLKMPVIGKPRAKKDAGN